MKQYKLYGFTLVELLVSVGIFSGVMVLLVQQVTQMKQSIASARLKQDVADLREALSRMVNCAQTLKSYTAEDGKITCNGTIQLRDFRDQPLAGSIGGWQVEGSCSSTGLTVKVKNVQNAKDPLTGKNLDYSNPTLNPLMGMGTPYGLCDASFKNARRVVAFSATSTDITYSDADCNAIFAAVKRPSPTPPLTLKRFNFATDQYGAPFAVANRMDAKCSTFCQNSPRLFVGGYLVDCSSSEVKCVCFR